MDFYEDMLKRHLNCHLSCTADLWYVVGGFLFKVQVNNFSVI